MRFNKFLKLKSSSGQVAIILILVVAISLIFYAVSLNLGKVSQIKTLTTAASNQGAGQLASQMASYGQQIFEVQLGGSSQVCGWTGVFAAILVIILIVISFYCSGCTAPAIAAVVYVLVVAGINLILQITYVQPGITEMWNDIKQDTFSIAGTFSENAIQTGLQGAVTDTHQVVDFEDLDRDGLFGFPSSGVEPVDKVARFAVYYTERLKEINLSPARDAIQIFKDALNELLFEGSDGWGLYDPKPSSLGCGSSECYECCVPQYQTDIDGNDLLDSDGNPIPLRPLSCYDGGETNETIEAYCLANSPYELSGLPPQPYPWVYDGAIELRGNAFNSVRELIGRDDTHQDFQKNPVSPNGKQIEAVGSGFQLIDAEGFYVPPDTRQSVAPFFYKVADWKLALEGDPTDNTYECHWCTSDLKTCPADQPAEIPQLDLGGVSGCVDGVDANSNGDPPLAADRVNLPSNILALDNECAENAFDNPLDTTLGFWKRGDDLFCSTRYPYSEDCAKHQNGGAWCDYNGTAINCACEDSGDPTLWPDDSIQNFYNGIVSFFVDTSFIRSQEATDLLASFEQWYSDIALWIEPASPLVPPNLCFMCNTEEGYLWKAFNDIGEIIRRLEVFRDTSYEGSSCDEDGTPPGAVWCVPPQPGSINSYSIDECRSVTPAEAATFDSNGNGIRGDLEDVVACLNWNVDDGGGNAVKFNACDTSCNAGALVGPIANCLSLPRSLVPALDTSVWRSGVYDPAILNQGQLQALDTCFNGCSNANCQGVPFLLGFPADPAFYDFEGAAVDGCVDWVGNVWNVAIQAELNRACDPVWIADIQQSAIEAQVQVDKFRKRRDFLQGRFNELQNMIAPGAPIVPTGVFTRLYYELNRFLTCEDGNGDGQPDGPACQLIQARIAYGNGDASRLPYHAIYAWRGEPPAGRVEGYWHAVRVDARLPGNCDNACNTAGTPTGDPNWPRTITFGKKLFGGSFGNFLNTSTGGLDVIVNADVKRCYQLVDTDGMVKMRVTRYDEDRDPSNLSFPNGVPIWDFRMFHPNRSGAYSDTTNLEIDCQSSMLTDPPDDPINPLYPYDHYGQAFILNERIYPLDPYGRAPNGTCWERVNNLLSRGITSETCAQYYFVDSGEGLGMNFEFVECPGIGF